MEVIVIAVLVLLSGTFAGLTLAFFSLDATVLYRKAKIGDEQARKVYAIRKKGNLLLCTLLLANVASYTSMAIFLGNLVNGVAAGIIATSLIFLFGEIVPQATFPRYALTIGAKLAWLVDALIIIFYPISAPIAWVLDKILGAELPTIWSKKEIKEIIKYHEDAPENIIDQDEERIVLGALSFSDKIAYDIMIPENQVFCLELNQRFTSKLVAEIKTKGHSRIPVYENSREHVVGMLYVLRLLGNISVIGKKVKGFIQYQELLTVRGHKKLDELLNQMISQKKQMALVIGRDGRFKGIVTIEDIVEEILCIKIDKM